MIREADTSNRTVLQGVYYRLADFDEGVLGLYKVLALVAEVGG